MYEISRKLKRQLYQHTHNIKIMMAGVGGGWERRGKYYYFFNFFSFSFLSHILRYVTPSDARNN